MPKKQVTPSNKPGIDETVLSINVSDFPSLVETLFRDDDTVGLILLLERLATDTISLWQRTKGSTAADTAEISDSHLLPAICKIGRVCIDAIRFHHFAIYQEGIEWLARIYGLGGFRGVGTPQSRSRLSWSVLAKQAFIQLYTIGSYAVFRQRMEAVRTLLGLQAQQSSRESRVSLLSYPYFVLQPSKGERHDYFDDALNQTVDTPTLFALFCHDKDELIDCLCQFDFIVSYGLWRQQETSHLNFGRFRNSRTNPIVEHLLKQEVATALFGSFEPQRLADFLREIDTRCTQISILLNGWEPSDWTEPIRQFLRQHPRQQEAI